MRNMILREVRTKNSEKLVINQLNTYYFLDIQGYMLKVYTNNLNNQPEYLVDGATPIWKKQARKKEPLNQY